MRNNTKNKKGFTIIELLVAILIFSIGGLSAYLLVYAAISSSVKTRNEIIAGNLAREKIELLKNVRDTNWVKILDWDKLDANIVSHDAETGDYLTGGYFMIENDFQSDTNGSPSIKIKKLSASFLEDKSYLLSPTDTNDKTNLCLDSKGRYTYVCIGGNSPTKFYSFVKVESLTTKNATNTTIVVDKALKLTSIIYNSEKGFTKWSMSTIITDWKR